MSRMQGASGPVGKGPPSLPTRLRQKPTIQRVPYVHLIPTATKKVILAKHLKTLPYGSFNVRLHGMQELEPRRIKSLNRP